MPEYTSTVTLIFGGNNLDAKDVEEYRLKLKDNFLGTFGILITDDEITDINKISRSLANKRLLNLANSYLENLRQEARIVFK